MAGRAALRVDANQGYTPTQAIAFANAVPVDGIELFEQPCAAGDWAAHMAVVPHCPLPLMLDESIYHEADIDEVARRRAARFVKVKLMKFATLERLAAAIERIRGHGLEPVLGNGVASDVGCRMETCVAARHIRNAGEMNGWLKMSRPIFESPMRVEGGAIRLPAGWQPRLGTMPRLPRRRWQQKALRPDGLARRRSGQVRTGGASGSDSPSSRAASSTARPARQLIDHHPVADLQLLIQPLGDLIVAQLAATVRTTLVALVGEVL